MARLQEEGGGPAGRRKGRRAGHRPSGGLGSPGHLATAPRRFPALAGTRERRAHDGFALAGRRFLFCCRGARRWAERGRGCGSVFLELPGSPGGERGQVQRVCGQVKGGAGQLVVLSKFASNSSCHSVLGTRRGFLPSPELQVREPLRSAEGCHGFLRSPPTPPPRGFRGDLYLGKGEGHLEVRTRITLLVKQRRK